MARLLKCCLNGARDPSEHARLPATAGQLAGAAKAAVEAGARALHFHPRDGDGRETLKPAWCDAAVAAVRAACPGVPIGLSTGDWIEPVLERRLEALSAWHERPDFCSVNLSETDAPAVMERLWLPGTGVEAGLGSVADAERLGELGVADRCVRILVEILAGSKDQAQRVARDVDAALDLLHVEVPRLHHGFGPSTWSVIEQAIELGRDVRVGLEDVLTLPDGSTARDNADLVQAAAGLMDEPASGV